VRPPPGRYQCVKIRTAGFDYLNFKIPEGVWREALNKCKDPSIHFFTAKESVTMPEFDSAETSRFGDALARPSVRKAFQNDPLGALERAGVDVSRVQPELVDLFADLSPEELEVVARVSARAKSIPDLAAAGDHVGVIIH
jgi:hypothetical protein